MTLFCFEFFFNLKINKIFFETKNKKKTTITKKKEHIPE